MNYRIERRLHRVMIKLDEDNNCPYSKSCDYSENTNRCNIFHLKCSKFKDFNTKFSQVSYFEGKLKWIWD